MAEDKMVKAIDVPLAVERAKRMRFKPHTTECSCDECEQFLTGWDMGFAHAYTFAQQQVKPYADALRELVQAVDGDCGQCGPEDDPDYIYNLDCGWCNTVLPRIKKAEALLAREIGQGDSQEDTSGKTMFERL